LDHPVYDYLTPAASNDLFTESTSAESAPYKSAADCTMGAAKAKDRYGVSKKKIFE
jgi:hypothetical protein